MNVFEWADYENPSTLLVWIYLLNDKKFVVVEIQISVIIWYFTTIVKLNPRNWFLFKNAEKEPALGYLTEQDAFQLYSVKPKDAFGGH